MSASTSRPPLSLPLAESALGHVPVERGELLVIERDVETRGVAGDEAIGAAEEAPERLSRDLRFDVPERGVERSDAAERRPAVAGLENSREHPVVERGDCARVLALDRRKEQIDAGVGTGRDARSTPSSVSRMTIGTSVIPCANESVDVADRATPVVEAAEAAVASDLHHRP